MFTGVDEKMLQCEICTDSMICCACMAIEDETFDFLPERLDLIWVCTYCKKAKDLSSKNLQPNLTAAMEKPAEQFSQDSNKVDKLEEILKTKADVAEVSTLNTNIKHITTQNEGYRADISRLDKTLQLMRTESQEIDKRRSSVVIKGLSESVEGYNDTKQYEDLLKLLYLQSTSLKRVDRLGKKNQDGQSRRLRLILQTEEDQKKLLTNAKKLKDKEGTGFPFNPAEVFISPDLTILQREEVFSRRQKGRKKQEEKEKEQGGRTQSGETVQGAGATSLRLPQPLTDRK